MGLFACRWISSLSSYQCHPSRFRLDLFRWTLVNSRRSISRTRRWEKVSSKRKIKHLRRATTLGQDKYLFPMSVRWMIVTVVVDTHPLDHAKHNVAVETVATLP